MTAIAILHREHILSEVAKGRYANSIARELGIKSPQSIHNELAKDEQYQQARVEGIEYRLTQRESELEIADDKMALSRARELLAHQRWRASVECPERWGEKKQLHVTGTITLDMLLSEAEHSPIDGEAERITL